MEEDLATGLGRARWLVEGAEQLLAEGVRARETAATAEYEATATASQLRRDASLASLDVEFAAQSVKLAESISRAVAELAPGAAGASWVEPWDASPGAGAYLRIGEGPLAGFAAIAPLLESPGWWLAGPTSETSALLQSTIARLVAVLPPRALRVVCYDPKLQGELGAFSRLRSTGSFPAPTSNAEELKAQLEEVVRIAAANAEVLATLGARDVVQVRSEDPTSPVTSVAVVVYDYPTGIDAEAQALLERLAESASRRGVTLLVQSGRDRPAEGVHPGRLADQLREIRVEPDAVVASHIPETARVTPDGRIPRPLLEEVVRDALTRETSSTGPTISFEEVLSAEADLAGERYWVGSAAAELLATIGRSGREPVRLALRSQNPPLPNLLIGGAVGQGKSNLLLTIIYSLAARYSPEELEFMLLDFKLGLEFQRFDVDSTGANSLPHARVLSLESNRDFGLAVLEYVVAELGRRSDEFKRVGASDIAHYRSAGGSPLARIVLVIDEFHVLFDGDDEITDAAVARLEQLAKQGRAFGIHLLLSSQTVSGISGLRAKGDGIFAQFPTRISLKNTVDESQAILSQGNAAAAALSFRGQFVLNRNFGLDPDNSNEVAVAAHANPEYLTRLQAQLWSLADAPRRPLVFRGRDAAAWPPFGPPASSAERGLEVWIGRPIEVGEQPVTLHLSDDVDQGVALVGSGSTKAAAVLTSIAETAIPQLPASVRVVVLDGGSDRETASWVLSILERAREHGLKAEVVRRDAISAHLREHIDPAIGDPKNPVFVLGVELQRVPDLNSASPSDDSWADPQTAASVLRRLGGRGALAGSYFIGWWTTPRSLSEALEFGHEGAGSLILLGLSSRDRMDLGGPAELVGDPRVSVVSRSSGGLAQVVVPFGPLDPEVRAGWRQ